MKTKESSIAIQSTTSQQDGPCQTCARYVDGKFGGLLATITHTLYLVHIGNSSFRLCPNCKDDLLAKLKKLEP